MFVESNLNIGSKFGFTAVFPIACPKEEVQSEYCEYDYSSLKQLRILLAEDNVINQLIAKTVLEQTGAKVEVAENGKIAFEKFIAADFELILMDIEMPDLNGEKTTQLIRSLYNKLKASVPIIALTANAMKGANEKYINIGMDNYISKPFTKEELYRKIAQTLKFKVLK